MKKIYLTIKVLIYNIVDKIYCVEKKIKSRIKLLNNTNFIILMMLFSFFEPPIIKEKVQMIHYMYILCQLSSFLIIIYKYILEKRSITNFNKLIFLYAIILCVATGLNRDGIVKNAILSSMRLISVSMIIEIFLKKDSKSLINMTLIIFEILLYINFFTIIIYPNGMYAGYGGNISTYWFLGHDNSFFKYIIVACCLSLINYKLYSEKSSICQLRVITLFIISLLTLIIRNTVTALIAMVIYMIMLVIILVRKNYSRIYKPIYTMITYVGLYISIVFLKIANSFSYIFTNVLHRKVTFSGRVYIWDKTLELMKKSPILGYGIESDYTRLEKYSDTNALGAVNSHNMLLEVLYNGGIVLLFVFCTLIWLAIKNINDNYNNVISQILSVTIFTTFIALLMEVYTIHIIIIPIILAYNINVLLRENKYEKILTNN